MTRLDLLGYTGSALFIIAYYFNSKESNLEKTYKFQILNALASTISIIYSYYHGAHAAVFTNVIWVLITLKSLLPLIVERWRTKLLKERPAVENLNFLSPPEALTLGTDG